MANVLSAFERREVSNNEDVIFSTQNIAPGTYAVKVIFENGGSLERVLSVIR